MWTLLYARADGSYVIRRNGVPYHVTQADPLYPAVAEAAEGKTLPPEPPPAGPVVNPRIISGTAFLGLFTAEEVAAMWACDPLVMAGALKVAAQDRCNLDSPECSALLQRAVDKSALTAERMAQVLANQPPA